MIGRTGTKTVKATSKKARMVSILNANDQILASKVNVVSTDKGKQLKKPRGKKKNKGKKKKWEESSPKKSSANPSRNRKPSDPCFICDEDH